MIRNLEIRATRFSGIKTTIFSTKRILPVDFKPSKRPLNYHNFLTTNKFSCVSKHVLQTGLHVRSFLGPRELTINYQSFVCLLAIDFNMLVLIDQDVT